MGKLLVLVLGTLLVIAGCGSDSKSDLTKDDREKMDKLFTEGIKNPSPPADGAAPAPNALAERGKGGTPLNAADQ